MNVILQLFLFTSCLFPVQEADQENTVPSVSDIRITMEFSAGTYKTLGEFVEALRNNVITTAKKLHPNVSNSFNINIILKPGAHNYPFSDMGLKIYNSTAEEILNTVGMLSSSLLSVYKVRNSDILVVASNLSGGEEEEEKRILEIWSIAELVNDAGAFDEAMAIKMAPETIISAINVGLSLEDKTSIPAEIKLHVESGLLFVKGTNRQIKIVDRIFISIKDDLMNQRSLHQRSIGK